jgi:hypothetical protein
MQQHIFLKKHPTRNASSNKRKEKKRKRQQRMLLTNEVS